MGSLNLPVRDQTCLRSLLWFALELMDTQDLDIMARDPRMLNQRLNQRLRLMLDFCMEDMDMVLVLDMVVLDIVVLDMPDMVDMDIPIMVKLYLLSFLKQKLKAISDWQCIIQCPCLKGRNCFEYNNKVITTKLFDLSSYFLVICFSAQSILVS